MLNSLTKFLFLLKKPKIIVVAGKGRDCAAEAIFQVLNQHIKTEKVVKDIHIKNILSEKTLIFSWSADKPEELDFLLKNSLSPILVITAKGEIPLDKAISKVAQELPVHGYLVLNFDDKTVREIRNRNKKTNYISFGFQEGADCKASDIMPVNNATNFKVNYNNKIVPIWLKEIFGKEQIYNALAAVCVGIVLDINLVEISQALKSYRSESNF